MVDILFLVEDPGAANLVVPLISELVRLQVDFEIVGIGPSVTYLRERNVTFSHASNMSARTILDGYSPRLIVVGTGENQDAVGLDVILLSRGRDITTVGLIDQLVNAEYRFRGRSCSSLTYSPDWLFVPDKPTCLAYKELGFDEGRVIVFGSPHLDLIQQQAERLDLEGVIQVRKRLWPEVTTERKVVVFLGEPNAGLLTGEYEISREYTLQGRGGSRWRSYIVLEEFLDALEKTKINPDPFIVLRLHPKNASTDFSEYYSEVDVVSSGGTPVEVMYGADAVVGMTSMALAEAVTMGRPVLSIVPRRSEAAFLPGFMDKRIPYVFERERIVDALQLLLSTPVTTVRDSYNSGASCSMARWIKAFISSKH